MCGIQIVRHSNVNFHHTSRAPVFRLLRHFDATEGVVRLSSSSSSSVDDDESVM